MAIHCAIPNEHWTCSHTNNAIEKLRQEVKRLTHVMSGFRGPYAGLYPAYSRYSLGRQQTYGHEVETTVTHACMVR